MEVIRPVPVQILVDRFQRFAGGKGRSIDQFIVGRVHGTPHGLYAVQRLKAQVQCLIPALQLIYHVGIDPKFFLIGVNLSDQGSGFICQVPFTSRIDQARFNSGGIAPVQVLLQNVLLDRIIREHGCVLGINLPEKVVDICGKLRRGRHHTPIPVIGILLLRQWRRCLRSHIQNFLIPAGLLELLQLRREVIILGLPQVRQLFIQSRNAARHQVFINFFLRRVFLRVLGGVLRVVLAKKLVHIVGNVHCPFRNFFFGNIDR